MLPQLTMHKELTSNDSRLLAGKNTSNLEHKEEGEKHLLYVCC